MTGAYARTFVILGHVFRVLGDEACAPSLTALDEVWARCARPEGVGLPHETQIELRREGEGFVMCWGQRREKVDADPAVAPWAVERVFYTRLDELRAPHELSLHAGALERRGRPLLLLGASGAGKSSLCLAGVRRGYGYLTDDLVISDGNSLWGVARAIQFDRVGPQGSADGTPPPWLGGLEMRPLGASPIDGAQPFTLPSSGDWRDRLEARDFTFVAAKRAPHTAVRVLSPVEALTTLLEAAYAPPPFDLGPWLANAISVELLWRTPEEGLDALEAFVETRADTP